MARQIGSRDIEPTLQAASKWIAECLIDDGSLFSSEDIWNLKNVREVHHAFVDHPDDGADDFITKLRGQISNSSPSAIKLTAEMLWTLLLFPSNTRCATKRAQIQEIWDLSGQPLTDKFQFLLDGPLSGIGSGGPAFNMFRPNELTFLLDLTCDLKGKTRDQRAAIFANYNEFLKWISAVPRKGSRQFRHMLRYFSFPDRVERISSNNDRRKILQAFGVPAPRNTSWRDGDDEELDSALLTLRESLQEAEPSSVIDFYSPTIKERWSQSHKIKTTEGEAIVIIPGDEEDEFEDDAEMEAPVVEPRQSISIQSKLAEIGAIMGFKVWIPRSDRARVRELMKLELCGALLDTLPLNYEKSTIDTIEQIDVIWIGRHSIKRAFEVEHTTAVYSGLLRMADLLALQPNMEIRLHIVAPDERKDKVFREMRRPVFTLLERGPLERACTFMSYESVQEIRNLAHLAQTNDSVIRAYEESAE